MNSKMNSLTSVILFGFATSAVSAEPPNAPSFYDNGSQEMLMAALKTQHPTKSVLSHQADWSLLFSVQNYSFLTPLADNCLV